MRFPFLEVVKTVVAQGAQPWATGHLLLVVSGFGCSSFRESELFDSCFSFLLKKLVGKVNQTHQYFDPYSRAILFGPINFILERIRTKQTKKLSFIARRDRSSLQLQARLPATAAIPAAAVTHPGIQPPPPPPPPQRPVYSISCPAPPLRPLNISGGARKPRASQTLALALSSSSTCRSSSPDLAPAASTVSASLHSNSSSCPSYFRFIHEDLRPWRAAGGVTRAMLARARVTASFRLVVLSGRVFVQRFRPAFQTRDLFTIWAVLQLLRRYPGRVPDLDLMFDCVDWPVVRTHLYRGKNAAFMPPLFRYCGDDRTLNIVFPDWSFWGWPEINIKPWDALRKDLKDGNNRVRWLDREPYAYWKGNPAVAVTRQELIKCNVSSTKDWNARIYTQDWFRESKAGYKDSNLGSQCTHRFLVFYFLGVITS
ncbi:hypothetical protein ABZP36_007849 [Zizania latifolia]